MSVQELITQFHEIAASPKQQLEAYLALGKKVVACVPVYTPEELIHSMDLIPFGAWGADKEIKEAKAYFPAFICSIMQSVLELGMTGVYQGISAIVIPSLCDSLKCLGQNWNYAVPEIPFIPMTYPQNRKSAYSKEFTKAGYQKVIEELEKITGHRFSEDSLKRSIQIYNDHNQVMRDFAEAAGQYRLTAADRNAVFKSAYFMEKAEHTALVLKLLEELKKCSLEEKRSDIKCSEEKSSLDTKYAEKRDSEKRDSEKKLRIVTSGILADAKELLSIFDEHPIVIVADDIAQESRQYRVDCAGDITALDSLAEKFCRMDHCSVLFSENKSRADYITTLAKEKNADAVIVVLTKFCDPEEFDYVVIKKVCEEKNIPLLLIEVDRQMVNYEQVRTAVQTFTEMLG